MTDTDTAEHVRRLRIKADMLRMGEPIAFGSDADALDEAADAIERLTRDLQSAALDAIAAHGQAADNYTRAVEAEARIAELTDQLRALARALHAKHFAADAPNWKPLENAEGLLSQIDNMTTGLTSKSTAEARIAELTRERDDARAAALEEAAKVADGMRLRFDLSGPYPADREDYAFDDALEQAAANIRALLEFAQRRTC